MQKLTFPGRRINVPAKNSVDRITNYQISSHISIIFQVTGNRCDTLTPVGILAPYGGRDSIAPVRINFVGGAVPTASVAVKVEQFSFVFVATDDMRIRGVSGWVS